jgi:hypothetical protein
VLVEGDGVRLVDGEGVAERLSRLDDEVICLRLPLPPVQRFRERAGDREAIRLGRDNRHGVAVGGEGEQGLEFVIAVEAAVADVES